MRGRAHPIVAALVAVLAASAGCEALVDFDGFVYERGSGAAAAAGGASGGQRNEGGDQAAAGAGATGGRGGASSAGGGGAGPSCLPGIDDDFTNVQHTDDTWNVLSIMEPGNDVEEHDTTSVGIFRVTPRMLTRFSGNDLGRFDYQTSCGNFGIIVTGHSDDGNNGPALDSAEHGIGVMLRDPTGPWVIFRHDYFVDEHRARIETSEENLLGTTLPTNPNFDAAMAICRFDGELHFLLKTYGGSPSAVMSIPDTLPPAVQAGFTIERRTNLESRGNFVDVRFIELQSLSQCSAAMEPLANN